MSLSSSKRIVIIGAGPTGLGAAIRCVDLNHDNWVLIDSAPPGGLARSYTDEAGFTWDLGGHVIFSHYQYFDDVMDWSTADWLHHQRESWVRVSGCWVPYPFQNNIHRLPPSDQVDCIEGLLDTYKEIYDSRPVTFEQYFTRQFGSGICRLFMAPYNFKVWAVPPSEMSAEWTGERVATVDLKRVLRNVVNHSDDAGWGPNATFRFPLTGGTGGIWSRIAAKLPQDKLKCNDEGFTVVAVDPDAKTVHLKNGESIPYDALLSTMPLDQLLRILTGSLASSHLPSAAAKLIYSSTHVIGLGIKGSPPESLRTKCWMYFPEDNCPFYRATVFSNYSPHNAPSGHWSLMLEVSESRYKPVNADTLLDECVAGCLNADLLTRDHDIVSKWHIRLQHGYPTPFLGRNELLDSVQPMLLEKGIYSRGRFGGWKYEVANQDHSMMQGVEAVEHMLGLGPERTYFDPNHVNSVRDTSRQLRLNKAPDV